MDYLGGKKSWKKKHLSGFLKEQQEKILFTNDGKHVKGSKEEDEEIVEEEDAKEEEEEEEE